MVPACLVCLAAGRAHVWERWRLASRRVGRTGRLHQGPPWLGVAAKGGPSVPFCMTNRTNCIPLVSGPRQLGDSAAACVAGGAAAVRPVRGGRAGGAGQPAAPAPPGAPRSAPRTAAAAAAVAAAPRPQVGAAAGLSVCPCFCWPGCRSCRRRCAVGLSVCRSCRPHVC
jgi:hypothetical protein